MLDKPKELCYNRVIARGDKEKESKMFLFNLQAVLTYVAIGSLPLALLELQLMFIGLLKPVVITPTYLIATLVIGAVSFVGAVVIEYFD
jgi:hypothetical protein